MPPVLIIHDFLNNHTQLFGDCDVLTVFLYNSVTYIKITLCEKIADLTRETVNTETVNALNLENGSLTFYKYDEQIPPVEANLNIEEW